MADRNNQVPTDEIQPMQIEPIYLSSDEDSTSQFSLSDIDMTDIYGDQHDTMDQHLVHQKNTVQVKNF